VCVNALLIWYTWYLVLLGCHTWTHDCWGHKLLVAVCGYDLQVLTQWKEGVGGVASWFDPHEQYFRCRKFNIKFSITFHGHKWRLDLFLFFFCVCIHIVLVTAFLISCIFQVKPLQ
jgi:hypothetical protein